MSRIWLFRGAQVRQLSMDRGILPLCPDWSDCLRMNYVDRITFNPKQCGGRPCIRGMRIRVKDVLELLAAKVSWVDILSDYPDLEEEDIQACIEYAASQLDHPVLVASR